MTDGNPDRNKGALQRAWFAANADKLAALYPDQWVAVGVDAVIAHDEGIDKVIADVEKQNLKHDDVMYAYLRSPNPNIIRQ
jgi:hypothetical protein